MSQDFSHDIFDQYFDVQGRIVRIVLHNGQVLEGALVGFFHGDVSMGEPYIIRWRFVSEDKLDAYRDLVPVEGNPELTIIIEQAEIKEINFK